MNRVLLLAKRELGTYLNTTWGFAIMAFVLCIDGILFNSFALTSAPRYSADVLKDFFYFSSGTTMIAGILLTMRLLAEERQSGTFALLQTAPITDGQIVMGKFIGAVAFLALITALSLYMPAIIQINGKVSWGQIGAGYLGLFMLGTTTIAMGTLSSAIARTQLFAALLGTAILVFFLLGWLLGKISSPPLDGIYSYVALFERHYQPFMRGRINTESVLYLTSLTSFFLVLATRILTARREA